MKLSGSVSKWKKPAGAIIVAATVAVQTPRVALAKFGNYQGATIQGQYVALIARIFGNQIANSVAAQFKLPPTNLDAGVSLMGPLNVTTGVGAGLLIADHVLHMVKIPYYSQYGSWLIKSLGVGNLIAGLVGGFLDPDPSQVTNPAPVNYPAITSMSPPVQIGMTQTASGGLQF